MLNTRKPTRLRKYDYSKNGVYFITLCTEKRANILSDIVGGDALGAPRVQLSQIGKIVEKHILTTNHIQGVSVDAYVIMPNHIHMLLRISENGSPRASTPTAIVPRAIAALKRFVHMEVGFKIFQRSYHDHIIRDEQDYLNHLEYIKNNPLKWTLDTYYIP